MNYFSRPYIASIAVAMLLGLGVAVAPPGVAGAIVWHLRSYWRVPVPAAALQFTGVPGRARGRRGQRFRAETQAQGSSRRVVTLIDHDAPAAQAGIRVNDVVLQLNGQPVEGAEQFGRMLREIPAGRKISLVISRDGDTQTMPFNLSTTRRWSTDVWKKLEQRQRYRFSPAPGLGILAPAAPRRAFRAASTCRSVGSSPERGRDG